MTATQTIYMLGILCAILGVVLIALDRMLDSEKTRSKRVEKELEQARHERDAAVCELEYALNTSIDRCRICKHADDGKCKHGGKCFEWRGKSGKRF